MGAILGMQGGCMDQKQEMLYTNLYIKFFMLVTGGV